MSHVTMTISFNYTTSFIKSIGELAKVKPLFSYFHLDQPIHSRIIALVIRSRPRKYRRSRGERDHFYKILSIVSTSWKTSPLNKTQLRTVDKCILHSLPKHAPEHHQMKQSYSYNGLLVNCRSVANKIEYIQAESTEANAALCTLTETWIKEEDDITPLHLCLSGYKCISIPRKVRSGGGLALIYQDNINLKIEKEYSVNTMECADFSIKLPSKTRHLGLIYRPPDGSVLQFCQELTTYLEQNINTTGNTLFMGVLNIHTNDPENQDTITFDDIIESLGLRNQVSFPTHRLQNTLDIIITAEDSSIISDTHQGSLFSDHYIVHYTLMTPSRLIELKRISYRKIKDISIDNLKNEISLAVPTNQDHNSPDTIIHNYNKALMKVMDKLTPVKTKTVSNKAKLPWFNANLAGEIRRRKWPEKIWHKDRTNINNYHQFYTQCCKVSNMLSLAKKDFYKATLNENKHNYKKIFGICNTLLGRSQEHPRPICNSNKELANNFNTFFIDKIQKIRKELNGYKIQQRITNTSENTPEMSNLPDEIALKGFRQVSIEETIKYIMKAPSKSCKLDPIPIDLLKEAIHKISPILTDLINTSLKLGTFPMELKKSSSLTTAQKKQYWIP